MMSRLHDSSIAPILIVEPDSDLCRRLAEVITGIGGTPVMVPRAIEALQLAAESRPALILIDLELPDLDGVTACEILKGDPETARIPVVVIGPDPSPGPPEVQGLCVAYLYRFSAMAVLRSALVEVWQRLHLRERLLATPESTDHSLPDSVAPSPDVSVPRVIVRAARYPLNLPVRFASSIGAPPTLVTGNGITHDVSLTGACLDLADRLQAGAALILVFEKLAEPLKPHASVVWVEQRSRTAGQILRVRHGVRFLAVTGHQRRVLEATLQVALVPDRIGLARPAPVILRPDFDAELLDISISGACVRLYGKLPGGAESTLVLPANLGSLEIPVRIIYSKPVGPREDGLPEDPPPCVTGLVFTDITFPQQAILSEILSVLALSMRAKRHRVNMPENQV